MKMKATSIISFLFILTLIISSNDALAQRKRRKKYAPDKAQEAIALFKKTDPSLKSFFNTAYGYAVFPSIGKGGIGIGGAAGKGLVYKNDVVQGGSKMTQITVGFQFGGQEYSEIIFFENEDAYSRFIEKQFQFAAQASAVALKSGVSADAKYTDGVAVFTIAKGGLMYEATVGGQKFKFVTKREADL